MTQWGFARRVLELGAAALVVSGLLPACTATANVSDVWMSIDEDGARRRNVFFTDSERATCVAEVGIGRNDVTIEMLIRQTRGAPLGTEDFAEMNAVVTAAEFRPEITQGSPGVLALTMKRSSGDEGSTSQNDDEAPLPPGSYVCEVMLDGALQKRALFNIQYAPCPTTVIQTGTPCLGFYPLDRICPKSGATGAPEPICRCDADGWSC